MDSSDDHISKPPQPSFLVYLKIIFLVGVVVFGMLALNRFTKQQGESEDTGKPSAIGQLFSTKKIQDAVNKEMRTNEAYKTVVNEVSRSTDNVLGEATQIKDQIIEQGTHVVTDYVYEQTVEVFIENMIQKLPQKQKDNVLQKVCQ